MRAREREHTQGRGRMSGKERIPRPQGHDLSQDQESDNQAIQAPRDCEVLKVSSLAGIQPRGHWPTPEEKAANNLQADGMERVICTMPGAQRGEIIHSTWRASLRSSVHNEGTKSWDRGAACAISLICPAGPPPSINTESSAGNKAIPTLAAQAAYTNPTFLCSGETGLLGYSSLPQSQWSRPTP